MPNRLISTELWNDETIVEKFTSEDKFFWLYLLTNPHNNFCGVLKNSPVIIARDMGLHKDSIVNLIYRFSTLHKMIYCDSETNEILILNWYKYNWNKSAKLRAFIEKTQETILSDEINKLINERKAIIFDGKEDTLSIPYRYPIDTPSIPIPTTIPTTISIPIESNINNKNINKNIKYINIYNYHDYYIFTTTMRLSIDNYLKEQKDIGHIYEGQELIGFLDRISKAINDKGADFVSSELFKAADKLNDDKFRKRGKNGTSNLF